MGEGGDAGAAPCCPELDDIDLTFFEGIDGVAFDELGDGQLRCGRSDPEFRLLKIGEDVFKGFFVGCFGIWVAGQRECRGWKT